MHQVQLTDQLYQAAKQRAQAAGFGSVDEFIADVLQHDLAETEANFDARFTPEINAYINRIASDMESGRSLSIQEVDSHVAGLANQARRRIGVAKAEQASPKSPP